MNRARTTAVSSDNFESIFFDRLTNTSGDYGAESLICLKVIQVESGNAGRLYW